MLMAILGGFIWGLMEGLWFFIVPDVFLSFAAMKGLKKAIVATLSVVAGAMVAACALYILIPWLGPESFLGFWSQFPGSYPKMFAVAQSHLEQNGALGLLQGPQSGVPYRFYIFEALKLNLPLPEILLWTTPARLERILLAPVVVRGLRWLLLKLKQKKPTLPIKWILYSLITVYWLGLYVWYWGHFLPKTYAA